MATNLSSRASPGAPGAGAGAIAQPPNYNSNMSRVYIVTVVSATLLFTFLALTRSIERYSTIPLLENGWFLSSSPPAKRNRRGDMSARYVFSRETTFAEKEPKVSHVSSSRPGFLYRAWSRGQRIAAKSVGGFSVAQLIVMVAYLALILSVIFYRSNITVNTKRAGWIAMAQVPIAFALGMKNNFIGLLIGQGYERINWVHRWVGQLMFLSVLAHAVGYLVRWTRQGTLHKEACANVPAFVALGGISFLAILSLPVIRRNAFNLFYLTHWIGFCVLLVAMCQHVPVAIPYAVVSACIFGLDYFIIRPLKSRYATATLEYLPALKSTRVTIPLHKGWRAGQHIRLRVLTVQMGIGAVFEVHPFTIASSTKDDDGLVLMCKDTGNWTNSLGKLADKGLWGEKGAMSLPTVGVIVEGPYGGPKNTVLSNFSGACIVAGGSGVTFATSTVQELIRKSSTASSRTRIINMVWAVQDPNSITPLLPTFETMTEECEAAVGVSLRIMVYYTRAGASIPDDEAFPESVILLAGQPPLKEIIEGTMASVGMTIALQKERRGVVIGVCGPMPLVDQTREIHRKTDPDLKYAYGGLELHEELSL